MTVKDKLHIIMITYNRKEKVQKTFEQLLSEKSPVKDFEILVLDNNSTDGTSILVEELMQRYPNIKYIKNKHNLGMGGNITKAISIADKEYIWLLGDDDKYNWESWYEVEEGINNNENLICLSREDIYDENDIGQLIFQFVFLPATIWKTSLVNDTVMRNICDNTYTIMPHLCPMMSVINNKENIRTVKYSVAMYGYNNTDVSYSRGNINSELYPKFQQFKFIVGFANIISGIKDKALRKHCMDTVIRNDKIYGQYKHFYINMSKLCCNDGQVGYWADVYMQLYFKHQIILLFNTLFRAITNTFSKRK